MPLSVAASNVDGFKAGMSMKMKTKTKSQSLNKNNFFFSFFSWPRTWETRFQRRPVQSRHEQQSIKANLGVQTKTKRCWALSNQQFFYFYFFLAKDLEYYTVNIETKHGSVVVGSWPIQFFYSYSVLGDWDNKSSGRVSVWVCDCVRKEWT